MTKYKIFERQGHYTQIDNLVFDELMQDLTGNQFKVLMAVIRKTIGWCKEQDKISLSQMMQITGIGNKRSAIGAIKDLETKGLILVHRPGGVEINSFSLNRKYVSSGKSATTGSGKSATTGSGKSATTGSGKSATHKRKALKKEKKAPLQIKHKELALKASLLVGYDKIYLTDNAISELNEFTEWLDNARATVKDLDYFQNVYWWGRTKPSIGQVKKYWAQAMAQQIAPAAKPPPATAPKVNSKIEAAYKRMEIENV